MFVIFFAADEVKEMIFEGGADCVSLHRKGLYVAGQVKLDFYKSIFFYYKQ